MQSLDRTSIQRSIPVSSPSSVTIGDSFPAKGGSLYDMQRKPEQSGCHRVSIIGAKLQAKLRAMLRRILRTILHGNRFLYSSAAPCQPSPPGGEGGPKGSPEGRMRGNIRYAVALRWPAGSDEGEHTICNHLIGPQYSDRYPSAPPHQSPAVTASPPRGEAFMMCSKNQNKAAATEYRSLENGSEQCSKQCSREHSWRIFQTILQGNRF